ncbi:MAG: nitroreductase family deazaflavin-dependent oxidoreductase [Actinomycetota bacterium]
MLTAVLILLGLLLAFLAAGIVFFVGMRTKSRPVLNAVRRFNRPFTNPRAMEDAGAPGAYASVVRHVGRKTGRRYETPVQVFPSERGFVIALPYGPETDWLKNVLASGAATIVADGITYMIDRPELVPTAEAAPDLPDKEQRTLRRFHVDRCLRVRRTAREQVSAHLVVPA